MKIGLAIYNFDPKKGGAERYAYDLSSNLVKRGHEVFVFCSNGIEVHGVHLVKMNTTTFPRWLRTLSFALNHKKSLKTVPVDVMLGFGNTLELDVYQSHGGVQKVWMEREIASYNDPKERRLKAVLLKNNINQKIQEWIAEYPIRKRMYRKIVAISDMIKTHMATHYNLKNDDFHIVYNGVDTERFTPAEIKPEGNLKILFSAGNFRLKGLHPLLLALGELTRETKNFHLFIMGRGKRERYQGLIRALNMPDLVTFLGEQNSPETVYRESHILVHPTFYDACSLTTMESMASGLPTITTKWNGASALISENEGYVIDDPCNVSQLAASIKSLFDKNLRNTMGKKARQKIEEYTIEKNVDEMEKILSSVSGAHADSPP
jgi:UDP-glucose:(heptosyl)LPS alpha-1,3-glucosyltransferase